MNGFMDKDGRIVRNFNTHIFGQRFIKALGLFLRLVGDFNGVASGLFDNPKADTWRAVAAIHHAVFNSAFLDTRYIAKSYEISILAAHEDKFFKIFFIAE